MSRDSGFRIELASSAVSVFFLASGISGLFIARLIEKFDVRIVIVSGALLASVSLWSIGLIQSTFQLFAVYTLFGVGFTASGLLPSTALVARWFHVHRARALSVASTGLSLGGVVITPLCASLVDNIGLEAATKWLAVAYLLGTIPVTLILRSSPAEVGLRPHGDITGAVTAGSVSFRSAISHSYFWLLSISYLFVMLAQVGAIAHQYGLLSERLNAEQSRYGIAVLPMFSIIGRLAGGWILDKVSIFRFTLIMMCLQAISLWAIAVATGPWGMMLCLALFGVTVGNLLMLLPLIIAEVYGLQHYSRIYAWANLLTMLGLAAGPTILGILYAQTESYRLPFLFAASAGIVAAGIFCVTRATGLPRNDERSFT